LLLQAGASEVDITLPSGVLWYEALAGQSLKVDKPRQLVSTTVNIEAIPVFFRGGAIVPRRCVNT
jgi:alpha-glucosidase (family GH31 glycosyl hydrolase)